MRLLRIREELRIRKCFTIVVIFPRLLRTRFLDFLFPQYEGKQTSLDMTTLYINLHGTDLAEI
jgi:hypothetical protein